MINRQKFFECFANEAAEDRFTQGKVYRFLYDLHSLGLLFHLDDDPHEIINFRGEKRNEFDLPVAEPTFTPDEAQILQELIVPKLFSTPLPNYENDPHRICIEIANFNSVTPVTLPQWGFSFDDSEDDNAYVGFTKPKCWNGWGCPMFTYADMKAIIESGEYSYTENYTFFDDQWPKMASFIVTDGNGELVELTGEIILDTEGTPTWVYDSSPLGWCFNIGDCQEPNAEDWEGYF